MIEAALCGAGFAPAELRGVLAAARPVGVLGDAETARLLDVPSWHQAEELPPGVACVVSDADRAAGLLGRGHPVLLLSPAGPDTLASCLRAARRSGVAFRPSGAVLRLPAVRRLVGAARALPQVRQVAAVCGRDDVHAVLHVLNDALGGLRPWTFDEAPSGTLAGVPCLFQSGPGFSITLNGELVLHGPHDLVTWRGVPLGAPTAPTPRQAAGERERAVAAELATFAAGEDATALTQAQLTVATAARALGERLDAGSGDDGSVTARLAAAAVAAAGDDEAESAGPADPLPPVTLDVPEADIAGAMRALEDWSLAAMLRSAEAEEVADRHAWIFRRWLAMLDERQPGTPAMSLQDAYAELGFPPLMAAFHARALERLPDLLRDRVTVQELLFGDGRTLEALGAYQNNVFTARLNDACGRILRGLAERSPWPLRVLELGGGTGVGTTAVLRELGDVPHEYLFTDVSKVFTVAAQERFAGLRTELLDIDRDFAAQGHAPASFDAVLAGNVLHNAAHLGRTLRRIRRVLPAGGHLVFTESVGDHPAVLTSMQFLLSAPPGGRRAGAADRRGGTDEMFVSADAWREELDAAGFTPRLALPEDGSPLAAAGQHLFWAVAR